MCQGKFTVAELIGLWRFSAVREAARLAVYDETMIRVNRYHMPAMNRVDSAFGATSQPIHMTAAQAHHSEWLMYRF